LRVSAIPIARSASRSAKATSTAPIREAIHAASKNISRERTPWGSAC
jgi:hypothetical protein